MLDSVEDDDGTLSPFDTLPDTKLLTHPECRDNSVVGAHAKPDLDKDLDKSSAAAKRRFSCSF